MGQWTTIFRQKRPAGYLGDAGECMRRDGLMGSFAWAWGIVQEKISRSLGLGLVIVIVVFILVEIEAFGGSLSCSLACTTRFRRDRKDFSWRCCGYPAFHLEIRANSHV